MDRPIICSRPRHLYLAGCLSLALLACTPESEVGSNFVISPPDAGPPAACFDQEDNDGDGLIDYPDEPGCESPSDDDETDPDEPPECADGIDNDGDGISDYPLDPGCVAASDDDETDPAEPPECADGIDNDGDGDVDYPDDGGCYAAGDDQEAIVAN